MAEMRLDDFTIGVEEEFQIVGPDDRELRSRSHPILRRARRAVGDEVSHELYLSQVEAGTPICRTLAEVREALATLRGALIRAAESDGSRIVAAGTHPFSDWRAQHVTPKTRYLGIAEEFAQIAREELIFGCHVHIGIADPDAAIRVMNRVRPWLPMLLAMTGNSPFWLGEDTGYASYRSVLFGRMPMVDVPERFASRAEYDALVATLVATDSIAEPSRIYWDVRPSAHFPTIEFRVADVCATIDEAVIVAALCRSLSRTCFEADRRGDPEPPIRTELLRAAKWRASRFGLEMDLIDPIARHSVPALELARKFLAFLRPDLEAHGEWDEVAALVHELLDRGIGAARQRAVFARTGDLRAVVDYLIAETARGAQAPPGIVRLGPAAPSAGESPPA